jgi:hypothetical protein
MTGLVRKAMFFAVLGLLAASAAFAGVPSCANSSFPTFIDLGACAPAGGTPDTAFCNSNAVTVTVRDIGNFPVVNQLVSILFKSDVATYDNDNCIEGTTDVNGVAHFCFTGAGRNSNGTSSYTGASAARIFFGSCATTGWCATASVCTYDMNGYVSTKGVEITDLAAWSSDYAARATQYRPRADYTHGGSVEILDLSYFSKVYNTHRSQYNCGATLYVNGTW